MAQPANKHIAKFAGRRGETVFHELLAWCLTAAPVDEFRRRVGDTLSHLRAVKDARALVVVGALLVENRVDALLSAVMPGYKVLRDNRDVSLSVKIDLTRALRLIPPHLLSAADVVRKIRNEFAHDISVDSFRKIKPQLLQSMRKGVAKRPPDANDPTTFALLVNWVEEGLHLYTLHVAWLNRFIRDDRFPDELCRFMKGRTKAL